MSSIFKDPWLYVDTSNTSLGTKFHTCTCSSCLEIFIRNNLIPDEWRTFIFKWASECTRYRDLESNKDQREKEHQKSLLVGYAFPVLYLDKGDIYGDQRIRDRFGFNKWEEWLDEVSAKDLSELETKYRM